MDSTGEPELALGLVDPRAGVPAPPGVRPVAVPLLEDLRTFREFGEASRELVTEVPAVGGETIRVPTVVNEFWTARQRAANSLHEVSYRACFKPQLPRFFIERLTSPGDRVYDPFMGRGTTLIEAALLGRVPAGNDVNPLSIALVRPRLNPPDLESIGRRLSSIPLDQPGEEPADLLVFYHPDTLRQISSLREYLLRRRRRGDLDSVDEWIAVVALNRLTGHSSGFFSVYSLPPNQAVSVKSQIRINERRQQVPPVRDVSRIILKKSRQLLSEVGEAERRSLARVAPGAILLTGPAEATPGISDASVQLVVTSPPFLDIVQYATDNWLRCWFLGFSAEGVKLTVPRRLDDWQAAMSRVFAELARVVRPGGWIAFEVGEVHGGATRLEEAVLPCGVAAGLQPEVILINDQEFTKTANCWGVANNDKGTNSNRIVVFRRP